MPIKIFISYSHADDRFLGKLHKHLAMLKRDNLITSWSDNQITAGTNFGNRISSELSSSNVFLALISPDYLASNYCYDKEFQQASEMADKGSIRIVPVILEPSDWLSSPLSKFMALPKDGKAISEWTNPNNAYMDIVNGLRQLALDASDVMTSTPNGSATQGSRVVRKVRLKREFDSIERADFVDLTYQTIKDYFDSALQELSLASDDLRTKFEPMSSNDFTCSLVNRAARREAHITIRNGKGNRSFGGQISYVFQWYADDGTSNGFLNVDSDDYQLYVVTEGFMSHRSESTSKSTPKQAAEWLWNDFVKRAGVEYE